MGHSVIGRLLVQPLTPLVACRNFLEQDTEPQIDEQRLPCKVPIYYILMYILADSSL